MRRLHALGTAFLFVGILALAADAAADPINIDSAAYMHAGPKANGKPHLTGLWGPGFSHARSGKGNDVRELRAMMGGGWKHSSDRSSGENFTLSAGAVHGVAFDNLRLDGQFTVNGASVTRSASASGTPFQFSYGYPSEPGRDEKALSQPGQSIAPGQVSQVQASGGMLVPAAVTYNSRAASSNGSASSVVTPEPASMLLLGSGLGLAALRIRRLRKK